MIIVETNATMRAKRLDEIKVLFEESAKSTRKSLGFFLMTRLRKYIETSGFNTWPPAHPLSQVYRKPYGYPIWIPRKREFKPFYWLGRFAKYRVNKNRIVVGFGYRSGVFNPTLYNIIRTMESGKEITVTRKMRRLFGAQRHLGKNIGVDFFPLRKDTSIITLPRRPIFSPFMERYQSAIPKFARYKIELTFNKKLEEWSER